jgi:hypothetical protein
MLADDNFFDILTEDARISNKELVFGTFLFAENFPTNFRVAVVGINRRHIDKNSFFTAHAFGFVPVQIDPVKEQDRLEPVTRFPNA